MQTVNGQFVELRLFKVMLAVCTRTGRWRQPVRVRTANIMFINLHTTNKHTSCPLYLKLR